MPELKTEIKPNIKQQECIDSINGKYLVLAGPGTGKTFTIIQRIKSMIQRGINPSKILCLTFSDAAANEMRMRLEKELDKLSINVNIFTYHGFCCSIIDDNTEEFELPRNYKIVSEAASNAFVKECINELNPKEFRTQKNDPYFYINTIKYRIEQIKKYRLTKEIFFKNIKVNPDWEPELIRLKNLLDEKLKNGETRVRTLEGNIEAQKHKIAQAKELWDFYELYQAKMEEHRYLDFNDMINMVLAKFEESPAFLDKIANQYEYILVDEYQDTNTSQNSIVFNLTHALKSENVFVVGDDDQIIYTFQGAKLDTMEKFLEEFPDTKVICLNENMRSTQNILDAAREVAKQDTRRLETNPRFKNYGITKELTAKNPNLAQVNIPVRCYKYADTAQEYTEIVTEIENIINSNDCPKDNLGNKKLSEIAVLTRSNAELAEFAEILKQRNIPYELKEGKNIFTISAVNIMLFYMQMLVNPEMYSYRIFQLLLSPPFNFHPKDYQTIYERVQSAPIQLDAMRKIPETDFLSPDKVKKFISTYDYLSAYKTKESIKNSVLEIGAKTGIFDYYLNTEINKTESIAGLKRLLDEAVSFSDIYKTSFLEEFVEYLQILLNDDISITTEKAPVSMNAVQLCTYFAAKGREFEYVYMPTLLRDKWEGYRTQRPEIPLDLAEYKTKEELDELKISDRIKVLYVGMTRAKHTLRLSYPQMDKGKSKNPSIFITNIQNMLEKEPEPFIYTEPTFWEQVSKSLIKREYNYKKDFQALVDVKLGDRAYSPTAVNSYLNCPRQYLYDKILDFNGRDGNPDILSYGSSIHAACEFAVKYAIQNGIYPAKEDFINSFKARFADLQMSSFQNRENFETRGVNALSEYYNQLINTPTIQLYAAEYRINFELDGIKFTGIIDRIDKNPDGTFTIYDYKTGSAKKGIEPDGEHEDYYNQIGLYKYFFEQATKNIVKSTIFIYPEDFTHNTEICFTQAECNNIINKFKDTIKNIKNYEFEPSYNPNACKYCAYKDFCNMEIV